MSELIKYILTIPNTQIRLNEQDITFSIGKIKSRTPSVLYFKFNGYDLHNTLIYSYTSHRWVINTHYTLQYETWSIPEEIYHEIDHYNIELHLIGVNSENPLYMNRLQLNSGKYKEYHQTEEEIQNIQIGFARNSYVNLYGTNENYLQIIRPKHEGLTSEGLLTAERTIIAPHLENESQFDDPVSLLYEYMYQHEQRITIEK